MTIERKINLTNNKTQKRKEIQEEKRKALELHNEVLRQYQEDKEQAVILAIATFFISYLIILQIAIKFNLI